MSNNIEVKTIVCDRCNGKRYEEVFMTASSIFRSQLCCEKCRGKGTVEIHVPKKIDKILIKYELHLKNEIQKSYDILWKLFHNDGHGCDYDTEVENKLHKIINIIDEEFPINGL